MIHTIREWLRANGINPNLVPLAEVPVITTDGRVSCEMYVCGNEGRGIRVDELTGKPVTAYVDVPLLEPPPDALLGWLRGEVRPERLHG